MRSTAIVLALSIALLLLAAPAPADADCLTAEAWYSTNGGNTKTYVVGPDHCVAPTPWPTRITQDVVVPVGAAQIGLGVGIPHP